MISNYKNENGITLISLITMIIVIIILASVATYAGLSTKKSAEHFNAVQQLKLMQREVNSMYQEYKDGNNDILKYGDEITSTIKTAQDENVETLSSNALDSLAVDEGERSNYRYFSQDYIKNTLNIDGITKDFLINMKKRSVILLKGIQKDGSTYYALSQIQNAGYNVEFEGEDEENDSNDTDNIKKQETINVCKPKVSGKEMIPVVWNEGTLSWVKADVTWNDENNEWEQGDSELKWYDYNTESKRWANIVTVEEEGTFSREYYKQAQAGTEILMKDITCMYVWIPRFENKNTYYTDSTYATTSDSKTIYVNSDVKFLGKEDTPDEGYEINSAFSYKDNSNNINNIEGFWIGKFEASNYTSNTPSSNIGENYGGPGEGNTINNAKYIKIKPNVTSWRNFSIGTLDETIEVINNDRKTVYGLGDTSEIGLVTTDMWDAVATLAQSEYGNRVDKQNNNIYGNFYQQGDSKKVGTTLVSYYTTLTGIVCEKDENNYSDEESNNSIRYLITTERSENTGHIKINNNYNYYEYWTENGKKGSTSSNVYGIYDMVGGAGEYTVSNTESSDDKYCARGGRFFDLKESDREQTNIFSSASVAKTQKYRAYSFRTALVIK